MRQVIHSNISVIDIQAIQALFSSYSNEANIAQHRARKLQRENAESTFVAAIWVPYHPFKVPGDVISVASCILRKLLACLSPACRGDPANQLLCVVALLMPKAGSITTPTYPCEREGARPAN
jgi:hypothetical protein